MMACNMRVRGSSPAMAMRSNTAIRPVGLTPRVVAWASLDQQDADMKAAEARWDAQLRDGIVKNVMAKDLMQYIQDGWTVLDVRPPSETRKVHVADAVEVPLFVPDTSLDPSSLLKQMSAFGLGGWWLGGTHMKPNASFLPDVQAKIPKDAKVIVACQKGLRSLAAAEQLSRAGYSDLAWVNGGLDNSRPGDVPTRGEKDIRYAGIGGVSEMVGWTEVQQENAGPAGSLKSVFIAVALILVLDGLVFAYEQYQYMQGKTPFQ
eukprot:jgi/Ulvmu1/10348/UM061_0031.1